MWFFLRFAYCSIGIPTLKCCWKQRKGLANSRRMGTAMGIAPAPKGPTQAPMPTRRHHETDDDTWEQKLPSCHWSVHRACAANGGGKRGSKGRGVSTTVTQTTLAQQMGGRSNDGRGRGHRIHDQTRHPAAGMAWTAAPVPKKSCLQALLTVSHATALAF